MDVGDVNYEFYEYEVGYVFINLYSRNYNEFIVELLIGWMIDFMKKYLGGLGKWWIFCRK